MKPCGCRLEELKAKRERALARLARHRLRVSSSRRWSATGLELVAEGHEVHRGGRPRRGLSTKRYVTHRRPKHLREPAPWLWQVAARLRQQRRRGHHGPSGVAPSCQVLADAFAAWSAAQDR